MTLKNDVEKPHQNKTSPLLQGSASCSSSKRIDEIIYGQQAYRESLYPLLWIISRQAAVGRLLAEGRLSLCRRMTGNLKRPPVPSAMKLFIYYISFLPFLPYWGNSMLKHHHKVFKNLNQHKNVCLKLVIIKSPPEQLCLKM